MKPDQYRQRFNQHLRDGLHALAASTLDAWRLSAPRAFEPQLHQVQLCLLNGDYRLARNAAAHLMAVADCPPDLALEGLSCLKSFALHDAALVWAENYPRRLQIPARDLAYCATDLSGIGAHFLALEWADIAVTMAPKDPVCLVNRALILSHLGHFGRAGADLNTVLGQSGGNAMAHWVLARLERPSSASNQVPVIHNALSASSLSGADRAFLNFALFKRLDDVGDYPAAWAALRTGNEAARSARPYHRAAQDQLFAAVKRAFPPITAAPVVDDSNASIPIFIVGLHRSGTSLMERMLGASPEVCAMGETERLAAAVRFGADRFTEQVPDMELLANVAKIDFDLIRDAFNSAAPRQAQGSRFITEKNPGNFLNIGFIQRALPNAKIVHMRRDPVDLCFANYRELLGKQLTHANALDDLVHYHRLYEDLMCHWHQVCPDRILDVDYEQLVQEPESQSRRVFDFCGVQWRPEVVDLRRSASEPVSTLSSVQVRQPVNTASIGRWRPYAPWLGALTDQFGDGV